MSYQAVIKAEINQSIRNSADAYDRYTRIRFTEFLQALLSYPPGLDFEIRSRLQSVDGFMVGRFTTTAGKGDLIRTKAGINQDGQCRFALYIPMKGEQELQQFSRVEKFGPGSLAMVSMSEPFIQRKLGDNDTLYFFMPPGFVDQRMLHGENICGRPIAIDTGLRRLAYNSVAAFQRDAGSMTDIEFRSATRLLGELVLLAFDNSADLSTDMRSVRTANLARAKRIIRAKFTDTNLKICDIARDCGISVRYLHELFRADGLTVSEYLKQQRLQHARHMLEHASNMTTVTEVCFGCGFSNASQFSTAFRLAFSVSPRDVLHRIG